MSLLIKDLSIQAGDFTIESFTLEITDREYFVLMGLSGTGKSLLLKAVCGLQPIKCGSISISDCDITHAPPRERGLGYVPQKSLLFPNMSVKENIRFPLEMKGVPKMKIDKKVAEISKTLGIESLLERDVSYLSGGESQKVALARALVFKPKLLLLDEPVSAVDEPTRREICADLRRVQRELKISTIHVCHSVAEAESVADKIGIMAEGRLEAIGAITEIKESHKDNPAVSRIFHS
jgi:ABC-type sugar transport system ATPase subunit